MTGGRCSRRGDGEEASIAFDFLGFGLSEKPPDHVYTLAWQADAVEEIVRRAGIAACLPRRP